MNPYFRVLRAGLQTTVQDLGRWGWQASGVPVAGPMDGCSHRIANALVGNDRMAASLEVALIGPEIEFEDDRLVAVTGAEFDLTLDGLPAENGTVLEVRSGSRLRFGDRLAGARAYVAVSGGIETPVVLGSRATHVVSRMGGFEGRALKAGDRLALGTARNGSPAAGTSRAHRPGRLPPELDPVAGVRAGRGCLRVMRGPQADWFADDAFEALGSGPYSIAHRSDRMGYRLQGPAIAYAREGEMLSDASVPGSIQVPRSGEPIILMADRQTTGGYPVLAVVISADINIAGQLAPGNTMTFAVCTAAEAAAARHAQEHALQQMVSSMRSSPLT